EVRQQSREPGGLLALQLRLAERLGFSKSNAVFGGRVRYLVSGSAPLSHDLLVFFHACAAPILDGYGLTETSATSVINRPPRFSFGSVGFPLPGTEIKIAPEDGGILIRSPAVMQGYHHLPEQTAEALTPDGWLRTGDIGEIDRNGY